MASAGGTAFCRRCPVDRRLPRGDSGYILANGRQWRSPRRAVEIGASRRYRAYGTRKAYAGGRSSRRLLRDWSPQVCNPLSFSGILIRIDPA